MSRLVKLLAGILVFDVLFYDQIPGLNLSIYALVLWFVIFSGRKKKNDERQFWLLSLTFFVSCFAFAWYGDGISFLAVFVSFFLTAFKSQYEKLKLSIYPVLGMLNFLAFPFRVFYFRYWLPRNSRAGRQKFLVTALIPAVIVIVFFAVYSTGSELLSSFYDRIFFNLNLPQLIGLSVLSFFFLFNLWFLFIPRLAIKINNALKDDFSQKTDASIFPALSFSDKNLERKGGEITLVLLNILLLIFILSYNYEQFFTADVPGQLSNEIHDRVATVIVSIVLAIALILFYFKSESSFNRESNRLKRLSFLWIVLNTLLVLSAFIKNAEYVHAFGLTFKRISVFLFLILCFIGLYITWQKIRLKKTNFFLVNRMAWTLYLSLILLAPINFSWIVTKYNLSFNKTQDIDYLKSLNYNEQLLFNTYRNNPGWQAYFEQVRNKIEEENQQKLLSSNLYNRYLYWKRIKNGS